MAQPAPIRILLVDDHSVVRMGLAAILGLDEGLCVVAEAEDASQALEKFKTERPDIVLMDVRMPGMSGIQALRSLRATWPAARVLMLTTSELDEDIQQAIAAGACGYLPKSVQRDELSKAIRHVHGGGHYVPEAMARRLEQLARRRHLSAREIEVLDGMRRGLSNRDIAETTSTSVRTVEGHLMRAYAKLGVAGRDDLRRGAGR